MKKLDLLAFAETNKGLIEALEHTINMLRVATPSESTTWTGRTGVLFDVLESNMTEFEKYFGEQDDGEGPEAELEESK